MPLQTRSELPLEHLDLGLSVLRLPLPARVEPVNCYIARSEGAGVTIVDTGLASHVEPFWKPALAEMQIAPTDVRAIVVTHFHPDHIGASGALAQLTGAPVLTSARTALDTPRVWGPGLRKMLDDLDEHLRRHGMPVERVADLAGEFDIARANIAVPAAFVEIADGQVLEMAGGRWQVIATPGHADGHICLYDAEHRRLLAGDHLLERISPAVGKFPDADADPLASYLQSLARTRELEIDVVLPGHGLPFAGAADRATGLIDHHAERVERCLVALDDGPRTPFEVSLVEFGRLPQAQDERFAVTETIAHLEHARHTGRAQLAPQQPDQLVRYLRG